MAARFPGVPLWAAGVSFGSWVAMTAGAEDDRVTTLVGIALPASLYDFSAVQDVEQAEVLHPRRARRDLPASRASGSCTATSSEPKELVVVDGADHLFDGHVSEVADAIAGLARAA